MKKIGVLCSKVHINFLQSCRPPWDIFELDSKCLMCASFIKNTVSDIMQTIFYKTQSLVTHKSFWDHCHVIILPLCAGQRKRWSYKINLDVMVLNYDKKAHLMMPRMVKISLAQAVDAALLQCGDQVGNGAGLTSGSNINQQATRNCTGGNTWWNSHYSHCGDITNVRHRIFFGHQEG